MSTELQKQINSQLRINELAFLAQRSLVVNWKRKAKTSFLFDTKATEFHAKNGLSSENRIPIFEDLPRLRLLGEQGLSDLESLNPKIALEPFSELFEVTEVPSIHILTQQEVSERLEILKRLTDFLVPYFLSDSAKICIEYLIQAYDINLLLGEYLFYSFLPYHDMPEFTQLVKTLDIPDSSEIKGLADSIKKTKTVITSRSLLSNILIKNPTLFKTLTKFWEKSLKNFHLTKNNALINLVTWLTVEVLEDLSRSKDQKCTEMYFENIIEVIIFGTCIRGSRFEELRSAGYCIIYKLATPLFRLSFELQKRLVEELFKALMRDFNFNRIICHVPETLLLINHILTQFGSIKNFHDLDQEVSIFVLKNQSLFINAFEQLITWNSDILQVSTLITRSVLNFGLNLNSRYLDSCFMFIEDILKVLYDSGYAFMMIENQSNLIKAIVLTLVDFYSQDKGKNFEPIIQMLHRNYPSEFISALSYSLGASSLLPDSQFSLGIKEKTQAFVDRVLKEDEDFGTKDGESSGMFLSLLSSRDPSVLNSCFEMIKDLITKSCKNLTKMNHLEKKVFDLALRHFLDISEGTELHGKFTLSLLRLKETWEVSQFLDKDDQNWRIDFIFKILFAYLRSKNPYKYSIIDEFFSTETSLKTKDLNELCIKISFLNNFGNDFEKILNDLIQNMLFILENFDIRDKSNTINILISENSELLIPLLTLVSQKDLCISQNLKENSSKLLSLVFEEEQIKTLLGKVLSKSDINHFELSLILISLEKLRMDLSSELVIPSNSFSIFSVELVENNQFVSLIEKLYFKFYYSIQSKKTDDKKISKNATIVLSTLRSIFDFIIEKRISKFNNELINISLVDTIEINQSKSDIMPAFSILKSCFNSSQEKTEKILDLVSTLSRNLFNIISHSGSSSSSGSIFYGRNVYFETLVSHSYSFIEIVISKLPISKESQENEFSNRDLLEVFHLVLPYAVFTPFLYQSSTSIKTASFRLCKAIEDKLEEFIGINHPLELNHDFDFSSLILNPRFQSSNSNPIDDHVTKLRSCNINNKCLNFGQILDLVKIILSHQNEIMTEGKDLMELISHGKNRKQLDLFLILNLIMLTELVIVENEATNLDFLSQYITGKFNIGSFCSDYHEILKKYLQLIFVIDNSAQVEENDYLENHIFIILSFLNQGITNISKASYSGNGDKKSNLDKKELKSLKRTLCLMYFQEIKRFETEFRHFELINRNNFIKQVYVKFLINSLDENFTRNLEDGEFVTLITGIVSQIANYFPESIKKVSLMKYLRRKSQSNINRLDLLVMSLLEISFNKVNKRSDDIQFLENNGKIILEWIYHELNSISLSANEILNEEILLINEGKTETTLKLNKDLIGKIRGYIELNRSRVKTVREFAMSDENEDFDFDDLIKTEIYLMKVLEFGVRSRKFVEFKDLEEVLSIFQNPETKKLPEILVNPMVINSIISLFSNISFNDENKVKDSRKYKFYLKICEVLFMQYRYFTSKVGTNISEKNFGIKSTFHSLSLFIDHVINKDLDKQSTQRIKKILFNILVNQQIKEIIKGERFGQIRDLLLFMEKLHNEVIYKGSEERFMNNQGIFMIIKYYFNTNEQENAFCSHDYQVVLGTNTLRTSNFEKSGLDILMDHLLRNRMFENKVDIYSDLVESVQYELQRLMGFDEVNIETALETKEIILENLIFMTRAVVFFLSRTLSNSMIDFTERKSIMDLIGRLIFLKTLTSKKILKKWSNELRESENSVKAVSVFDSKIKTMIDKLEREFLITSLTKGNNEKYYRDTRQVQKEIDDLIQCLSQDINMKKYLIVNWDLSRDHMEVKLSKGLKKKFENSLLINKMEYFGIIIKEALENKIRLDIDIEEDQDQEEKLISVYNTVNYLLEIVPYGDKLKTELEIEEPDSSSNKMPKLKLWVKNWYVLDLILRFFEGYHQEKLNKLVFSRILSFYKLCDEMKDKNGSGLIYKIPLIQNFLLSRISKLKRTDGVSLLVEIETITRNTIRIVKFLGEIKTGTETNSIHCPNSKFKSKSSTIFGDRKSKSILLIMLSSHYGISFGSESDEIYRNIYLLPYLSLISVILSSEIGEIVSLSTGLAGEVLLDILLNDNLTSKFDLSRVTGLLQSERLRKERFSFGHVTNQHDFTGKQKDERSLKFAHFIDHVENMRRDSQNIYDILEVYMDKILVVYSYLTSSYTSLQSSTNEDFVSKYSQIFGEISSELFSKINSEKESNLNLEYQKLTNLIIIASFSINFMDGKNILSSKSFIERFSQFYLLLLNFLIINFSKIYSYKESNLGFKQANDHNSLSKNKEKSSEMTSGGRSKTRRSSDHDEKVVGNRDSLLFRFVSGIFGSDILYSHGLVNSSWFGEEFIRRCRLIREQSQENEEQEMGREEREKERIAKQQRECHGANFVIWKLESSISTLVSEYALKLSGKKLREFVLLVKRLVHRNGDSFLSRVNSMTNKSGDSRTTVNTDKEGIKELYGSISGNGDSTFIRDIYSCRIWVLFLLGIFSSTGEYGVYCLTDDIALDIKSICDMAQINALTCAQNITISHYKSTSSAYNRKRVSGYHQIAHLTHLDNDYGWYWYHLGIYNLVLIKRIYETLSTQKDEESRDIPNSVEDYLINPIVTNLDMFALFDPNSIKDLTGCGRQWEIILGDIWVNSVRCFRNNDLILAEVIRLLASKMKNGSDQVRMFSAEILLKLWRDEVCSMSILSHLSDMLPAIKELLSDQSEEIVYTVKSVIRQIEDRTGEELARRLY
ncbi:HEAT repeat family protein [Cryptosporidium felis]|nr:HEAT repeat family protein [Cryptosporidium felis]